MGTSSFWPVQSLHEVADDIYVIVHGNGEVGVSNSTFIVQDGRALLVDTMTFPEMALGIDREIKRHGAQVDLVLNTHHHIDHTGGNAVFSGAHFIAHPGTIATLKKLGVPATIYDHLMPKFQGRFADVSLVIPEPFPEPLTIIKNGQLHCFTPAHTAADSALWFPDTRVLIAGDVVFNGVTPLAVNGLLSGWLEALDTLIALKPEVVVPGHGSIGTLQDMLHLRAYLSRIYELGVFAVEHQLSLSDALNQFDPSPFAGWLESNRHAINLERAMQEARGEISRTDLAAMPKVALRDQGRAE